MLICLADFCSVWKKACPCLLGTSCQKTYFVLLSFASWEIMPSIPCSPSQWDFLLYQSLPYPSQCLCWKMFQLFNLPFHISCQYSFLLGAQAYWAQGIPHTAVSWSHRIILTRSHASLCVLCRGDAGLVINWKKTWSDRFGDQLFKCLVAGSLMVEEYLSAFYQPVCWAVFHGNLLWILQQQLIHNFLLPGRRTVAL